MADKILRVEFDQDAECPMTEWDGMWTLKSFNRNSIHHVSPSEVFTRENKEGDPIPDIGLTRKFAVGLAFMLDYYEHGQGKYSLHGEGPQCQWDTSRCAGVLVWENKPEDMGAKTVADRAEDARGFLETYNNWMNGSVYGYMLEDAEGNDIASCWGFYDEETLVEDINHNLEAGDRVMVEGDASFLVDESDLTEGVKVVDEFEEEEVEPDFLTVDGIS